MARPAPRGRKRRPKNTRTAAARIELANTDGGLKPEMFATFTIGALGEKHQAIALPDAPIVLLDCGERIAGRTVPKPGIKTGDQVVTEAHVH